MGGGWLDMLIFLCLQEYGTYFLWGNQWVNEKPWSECIWTFEIYLFKPEKESNVLPAPPPPPPIQLLSLLIKINNK
jgi:hypothetical protein